MDYNLLDVSIVIPNWNGKELLQKHLPSVIRAAGNAEIIIVDDASTDDSVQFITETFPFIKIIQKQNHQGFSSTVNFGVARARGDIIVLLNTDIEPEKNFLNSLLPHFSNPKLFAVACMDKSIENGKMVLRGRGIAKWERGFYIHRRGEIDASDTAWVSGGSGAFRKKLWEQLGGLDTLFNPFYWEDIDLSYRALKVGFTIAFETKSVVIHTHEEGKIKREFSPDYIKRISYRNQLLFIWKNCTDRTIILSHYFFLPIRLVQTIHQGDFQMLKGFIDAVQLLPKVIAERKKFSLLWKRTDKEITKQK